ncbi:ExbD/TolR family protein [Phaeodactylibacter luteus]|uniref:Biopolymer transporter ExbD n=1 Tax=Phaeodactylibacter luteus TaxID=1564516 RepID=A0A5C6RMH4_9BACT|nr:biopolymer transporter ExbD [Phaeodactylibacter luteus]TXB63165.1 biopolymer transporter ExbD [Phaeodactylibacter luteus]
MFNKKTRRSAAAIQAGSMADIAFLLLIFFLVTTTIASDTGIRALLPPWGNQPPTPLAERNVLSLFVNEQGQALFEGEPMPLAELSVRLQESILNRQQRSDWPRSPRHAVIALQHSRSTPYQYYVQVYDALQSAYAALWEEEAQARFGQAYSRLSSTQQGAIRSSLPMTISESEPFGAEVAGQQ